MTDGQLEKILKILITKLEGIDFALIGSLNLKIQGLNYLDPRDIDFLTNNEGIKKISEIFGSELNNESGYLETSFQFEGIEIHLVSNQNNPIRPANFKEHLKMIKKYNINLPCLSLESELFAYEKMDREKDVEKIKNIKKILQAGVV